MYLYILFQSQLTQVKKEDTNESTIYRSFDTTLVTHSLSEREEEILFKLRGAITNKGCSGQSHS